MTKKIHKLFLLLILSFFSTSISFGQLYNCNGFLQGKYVEAGINWNGCFGSSSRPPAGYHPDTLAKLYTDPVSCGDTVITDTSLGFVADPGRDGWSVGTPPYFGDYILPGGPNEGWGILDFGTNTEVWNNNNQYHDTLPFGTTSSVQSFTYDTATHTQTIMSQALTSSGAIYITEFISLDTTNLFVKVHVEIDNTALTSTDNVYYIRAINPHNDAMQGGSLSTKEKIIFQNPDTLGRAMVAAYGTHYPGSYIAMAALDSVVEPMAFIAKSLQMPDSGTLDMIYDQLDTDYLYGQNDSVTGNVAMGLVFNVGVIPSGSSDTFSFYYAFGATSLDSVLGVIDTSLAVPKIVSKPIVYSVYPNPVVNSFRISGLQSTDAILFYDMLGRQVTADVKRTSTTGYLIDDLAPGSYFILIEDAYGNIKGKVPVQKL